MLFSNWSLLKICLSNRHVCISVLYQNQPHHSHTHAHAIAESGRQFAFKHQHIIRAQQSHTHAPIQSHIQKTCCHKTKTKHKIKRKKHMYNILKWEFTLNIDNAGAGAVGYRTTRVSNHRLALFEFRISNRRIRKVVRR